MMTLESQNSSIVKLGSDQTVFLNSKFLPGIISFLSFLESSLVVLTLEHQGGALAEH